MEVYLVQHGEAVPKSVDRTRPLSDQGRKEVLQVAAFAARMGLAVGEIRHSGKTRAEQTAALLGETLSPADYDYEFAVCSDPRLRYSFDADNDGAVELVYSDEDLDGELDTLIGLKDGKWTVAECPSARISGDLFQDRGLRKRFEELASR